MVDNEVVGRDDALRPMSAGRWGERLEPSHGTGAATGSTVEGMSATMSVV